MNGPIPSDWYKGKPQFDYDGHKLELVNANWYTCKFCRMSFLVYNGQVHLEREFAYISCEEAQVRRVLNE